MNRANSPSKSDDEKKTMNRASSPSKSDDEKKTMNRASSPSKSDDEKKTKPPQSTSYPTRVIDAFRGRKIFQVNGNYYTVRKALLARGWLEKLTPTRFPKLQTLSEEVLLKHARLGNEFEAVLLSKLIEKLPAYFVWQDKQTKNMYHDVLPHRSIVRRGFAVDFSTKVGLIGCAEQERWFRQPQVYGMTYPRFYRLGGCSEERAAFIEDFCNTQCRSLLRFLIENINNPDVLYDSTDGKVPTHIVQFAIKRLNGVLKDFENLSLDEGITSTKVAIESEEWKTFMNYSSLILGKEAVFKSNTNEMLILFRLAKVCLYKIDQTNSNYCWDGFQNLWILKPGYSCRGSGIIIKHNLEEILLLSRNSTRRYIVQKYIERPLLIYKTKFDIRQYMLLNIGNANVSIWMYRDCYLRFSSQEYTVDDLSESIHLTNNSVQKKYKNKNTRDSRLPSCNMWSLERFKLFLQRENAPEDVWEHRIYSGFRENLIAVVLASMDETELVENSFELYGCDFMLDDKYNPILIEINSVPDLTPSTEVTAKICPNVLKDLVKVIVDLSRNSRSSTGLFELVYQINYKTRNEGDPQLTLNLSGQRIVLHKQTSSTDLKHRSQAAWKSKYLKCAPMKSLLLKNPKMSKHSKASSTAV